MHVHQPAGECLRVVRGRPPGWLLVPLLSLLLAGTAPAVRAEPDIPPPAEFVASMELGLAVCSKRMPAQATALARLREVLAGSFAGRSYASYIGTAEYEAAYRRLSAEMASAPDADIAESCRVLLQVSQGPAQGILYYR